MLIAQGLTAEAVKALNAYLSEFAADGEAWLQLAKLHIDALNYEVRESNTAVASALGSAGFTGTSGTTTPTGVSLFIIASPLSKTKANVECLKSLEEQYSTCRLPRVRSRLDLACNRVVFSCVCLLGTVP